MNADLVWKVTLAELREEEPVGEGARQHRRLPGWLVDFDSTPLVGVRKTAWKNALHEWEWLMYGGGYVSNLHPSTRHWWEQYGPVVDGIGGLFADVDELMEGIKRSPLSRRNILTTLSTPCNVPRNDFVLQVTVHGQEMELFVFQRTCDIMRGAQHNWLQYWAFGLWLAKRTDLALRRLRWVAGDVHLYSVHDEIARKCCGTPRGGPQPWLVYNPTGEDFRADDFTLSGPYSPTVCDKLEYV